MRTYFALVDHDAASAFGVRFPDLPGCFSAADEEEDIVKNAIEALHLHLEDEEPPKARNIDDIRQDPEVASALREGAYLLAVPLVTAKRRVVRVNLSLDKGTVEAIDAAAEQRGLTRSAFVAEAAQNEIEGR